MALTVMSAGGLVGVIACEQVLSIDGPIHVAPHEACGLEVPAGSCQACLASSCCSQATACEKVPACAAYETCVLACGSDYACRTQCAVDHDVTQGPEVPALDQCVVTACNDACGMSCGITAAPSVPDAAITCEACMAGRPCAAAQACGASLECETIEHCVPTCSTVDCHDTCLAMDDAGTFTALEVALISSCYKECNLGNFWLCVGHVAWPLAPAGVNEVDFKVKDSTSGNGLVGASVKACDKTDPGCGTPAAQATSDGAGQGILRLPAHEAVGLGFQGYYDIEAPQEVPWLIFSSSPITQARVPFNWTVLSQTAFQTLTSSANVALDPTRGHIAVAAVDCLLSPASGVIVSATGIDAKTKSLYLSGGALVANTGQTDITGYAFFLNVPPGNVTIQTTPKALNRVSSSQVVFTRPGAVSSVIALPTP